MSELDALFLVAFFLYQGLSAKQTLASVAVTDLYFPLFFLDIFLVPKLNSCCSHALAFSLLFLTVHES